MRIPLHHGDSENRELSQWRHIDSDILQRVASKRLGIRVLRATGSSMRNHLANLREPIHK